MIELFKNRLHEMLQQKDVSLAMFYDKDGNILWHTGRQIQGRNIEDGKGFCRSVIQESIRSCNEVFKDNVHLTCDLPESDSAKRLLIKSIVIYPIVDDFFMYIDSGIRMAFSDVEHGIIRMLIDMFKDSIQQIRRSETDSGGIAGESQAIERIKKLVLKYSIEEDCVLLTGETGVGKTHIAELIHRFSGRKGKFVVVETTAISENLFESEVFGHKKGAFTGAVENKRGLVDEADSGTLFFDEISEIPLSFQAKLLRFIEVKKYRVLGDPRERDADVKILAASNKDLRQMIALRQFRQDLFYRLSVLNIHIPPLRERPEDFRPIIISAKKYLKGKTIGNDFWEAILEYPWPGNVRELFSVLKRAGILCDSPITGQQIKNMIYEDIRQSNTIQSQCQAASIWELLQSGKNFWDVVGEPFLNRELTRFQVKELVGKVLIMSEGKYVKTLKFFNLAPSHYKRFMKFLHKHQLQ